MHLPIAWFSALHNTDNVNNSNSNNNINDNDNSDNNKTSDDNDNNSSDNYDNNTSDGNAFQLIMSWVHAGQVLFLQSSLSCAYL